MSDIEIWCYDYCKVKYNNYHVYCLICNCINNWAVNIHRTAFLIQACISRMLAPAWFLKIAFVCDVSMCVYVPPRLYGMIWTPYDWINKFYSFYATAVVGIISRCGLRINVHSGKQPNKQRRALCKPSIHFNSS